MLPNQCSLTSEAGHEVARPVDHMIFQKVKNPKVAEEVIDQIEDLIVQGVLRPGDRLPPERELSLQLGVSRPSLRDAIKVLEGRGLLVTRHGGGTSVGNVIGTIFADEFANLFRSNDRAITDYLEFRKEIDLIAGRLAAERATDADREILSSIHDSLCDAAAHDDREGVIRHDTQFHIAIVAAAHNIVLLHSMRSILEQMVPIFYQRLPHQPDSEMIEHIITQHGEILQAVHDHNPEDAHKAIVVHCEFIETTLKYADNVYQREHSAQMRLEMLSVGNGQSHRSTTGGGKRGRH